MDIDDAMATFERIPGAVVGFGPKHPTRPNQEIAHRVAAFLDDYPALRGYPCYVEFLEKYAGARIDQQENSVLVYLFGLADVSFDLVADEGDVVTDGFLQFAQGVYREDVHDVMTIYQYDFAFDVSGARDRGVYRSALRASGDVHGYTWYTADFSSWLDELVAKGGVYEPPKD